MVQNWLAPAGAGSFRYLFIYRALYIPGGAEFVPSTVSVYTIGHFQHQKMQLFPCSFLMGDPSITKELIPQLDLLLDVYGAIHSFFSVFKNSTKKNIPA